MTMPAGAYYVGDLCYVMHPQWDEFCKLTIGDDDCMDGEFCLANGVRFASFGTKYGDGVYYDGLGNRYGVDAGLIGCIRVEDISDPSVKGLEDLKELGTVHVFDKPFDVKGGRASDYRKWDGVIQFGHVIIETDPQEEEEEEEEYEEEYED